MCLLKPNLAPPNILNYWKALKIKVWNWKKSSRDTLANLPIAVFFNLFRFTVPYLYDWKKNWRHPYLVKMTLWGTLSNKKVENSIFGCTPDTSSRHPCVPRHRPRLGTTTLVYHLLYELPLNSKKNQIYFKSTFFLHGWKKIKIWPRNTLLRGIDCYVHFRFDQKDSETSVPHQKSKSRETNSNATNLECIKCHPL